MGWRKGVGDRVVERFEEKEWRREFRKRGSGEGMRRGYEERD